MFIFVRVQSLLDLALRTTAAIEDPCHEVLTCCVERSSLLNRLGTLSDLEYGMKNLLSTPEVQKPVSDSNDQTEPVSVTGLETFSLSYKGVRAFNKLGTTISRSSVLCRSMLKFINSLLHYLTFEVLEPNWHVMHNRLLTAKSIDEDHEKEEARVEEVTGQMEGRADKPLTKASRQVGKNLRKNNTKKANEADTVVEFVASVSPTTETGHVSEGAKPKGRGAPKKAPTRKQKMPTTVDSEEGDDEVLKLKERLATYNIDSPSDQIGI
ncbi:uncharacterized protein LOC131239918 isoform X2 [Magnolia sinica]|nr:uncharacterized protein LOC131239918 isoform X2 [Magnolia sinica]XP_058093831.1 uncharacterized protein LOC131239918 isoform X2 [Magnolia sinica]XP_058093832.1 uncharacterized protein LOC131239918 isoform X2 [Magnolia sinica]XP_058093833.1 uncharacterized protein LOC131239918 isoform X2 [Magnolia sinica]XP_058093834.1 uncharacterized protein LOC131239918 isoform X2 [Magnolia sinica]